MNGGENSASLKKASESASIGRGSASPSHAADLHRLARAGKGIAPIRGWRTRWLRERRRALEQQLARLDAPASGGATSGIGSSAISGALQGTEKAASASATSAPSCSIRAESVLSERPSRSMTVRMLTGPGSGARA